MRDILTILFLISLPWIAALGHDAYLYFESQYNGEVGQDFMLSDVGFLWSKYAPDSMALMKQSFEPEQWRMLSKYILQQYAVVVAGIFSVFFYFVMLCLKLLHIWPFNDGGNVSTSRKNRKVDVILGDAKESGYKYKRK